MANDTSPLQGIVDAYRAAQASVPTTNEYSRRKRITEQYVASLDPQKHKTAIDDAWARFNEDNPPQDDLVQTRQTIKSIGRVLKGHGYIE